jgi:hypothetical protein
MRANGRRNLLAIFGTLTCASGVLDAYNNAFVGADPATFFLWGAGLLTTSVLRRKDNQ